MNRFVGVVGFILGGWLLISGLNHMSVIGTASAEGAVVNVPVAEHNTTDAGGIIWLHSLAEAQKQARASGKPIFIDFYASWCANCLAFAEETVNDDALNKTHQQEKLSTFYSMPESIVSMLLH
ncbi:MAG: hypothetical protein HOK14_05750 [Gammaproteobacteria bacterium]|nr:hypothetical protein [Gammaproteobacteria bacterium]MBT6419824.1 hypothetical protein [Gammaproteobacteria bacterium]MBT7435080.1 hypothetical protein [Gammaproteobacteria bacterium]